MHFYKYFVSTDNAIILTNTPPRGISKFNSICIFTYYVISLDYYNIMYNNYVL